MMSNYPPGVTGNEPQITGEWPCDFCGALGYEEDEDGKHACPVCKGTGILPEDVVDRHDTEKLIRKALNAVLYDEAVSVEFEYDKEGYMSVMLPYTRIADSEWLREEW